MVEQEHNEDQFEQFYREKTGDYDIQYRESDWQRLDERLDEVEGQARLRRRRRWMAAAAMLLVSLLGYFTYQNYVEIQNLNRAMAGKSMQNEQQPPSEQGGEDQASPRKGKANQAEESTQQELASAGQQGAGDSTQGPVNRSAQKLRVSGSESGDERDANVGQFIERQPVATHSICIGCLMERTAPVDRRLVRVKHSERLGYLTDETATGTRPSGRFYSIRSTGGQPQSGFSAGLVLSPDLSTVGSLSHFTRPGYKFGIQAGYRFNKNLSLRTGLMYSKVQYTAYGDDYHPPAGFWKQGEAAYETEGLCLILDIPVNLRYDLYHFSASRLYTSAGLASYIMLNEKYRFDYRSSYAAGAEGWSGETGTRHWMSNASLSVGYEVDVSKRFSLRAEPFLRIPLREVGWGNVRLYSMGTMVSFGVKF